MYFYKLYLFLLFITDLSAYLPIPIAASGATRNRSASAPTTTEAGITNSSMPFSAFILIFSKSGGLNLIGTINTLFAYLHNISSIGLINPQNTNYNLLLTIYELLFTASHLSAYYKSQFYRKASAYMA